MPFPLAGLWRSLSAGRLLSLPGLGYWVSVGMLATQAMAGLYMVRYGLQAAISVDFCLQCIEYSIRI
ncbi:MAG: hypothetical protein RMY28_037360 [Nostoc sp. ChiSLP01]|nr:hypothetical protein [Nostoc sp. CmiSLP01]MDZ8287355.1 hypothetical protein [Nostoc sp. ChiSLP01]